MLQFLVCRGGWYEEAVPVSSCQSTDYTSSGYGGVNYGDDVGEFGLKDGVEV